MYRFIICLLLVWVSHSTYAQSHDFMASEDAEDHSEKNPIESSVTVGTQVSTSFKNSAYWSNYILPTFSYDVNERLTVKVGIGVYHTRYNNAKVMMDERTFTTIDGEASSVVGYAMGIYKVNPKLDLIGGYTFNESIPNGNSIHASSLKSGSVGFNYKVSSGLSIGAQMGISNLPQIGMGALNNGFINSGPSNYMFP